MGFLINNGLPAPLGLSFNVGILNVAVLAPNATAIYFCVFDAEEREIERVILPTQTNGVHHGSIENIDIPEDGLLYGLRAEGEYNPSQGQFYDINKLLVDPYAIELNKSFVFDEILSAPKFAEIDTAHLIPKAVFRLLSESNSNNDGLLECETESHSNPPQFIYELSVKGFTQRHPDVPENVRGTLAALREPCVIAHLLKLGVDTVELMPIAAWINERHLEHLGLHNAWGYNPVAMMAIEPRLSSSAWRELRLTVKALKEVGIQTILDVVFNHTGEGDVYGPTLSLRGLDNLYYYKHDNNFQLINDTGCGNTLACEREGVAQLMLDSMRHWMMRTGVAGFRFDLAPVMGRLPTGFSVDAPLLAMIKNDPIVSKAVLVAEPWDIGPGGYQLGNFDAPWLEWNDKYRDDVRRFWQGQPNTLGALATRLAGSSDVFQKGQRAPKASVNFIAAHDGFCLRDLVSYSHKYNQNNGEQNRDGSNDNHSWSNGVEGELPEDASPHAVEKLRQRRLRDVRALLATLFLSQGTLMMTAGDEMGRTQHGNNNAYAQDNEVTWLDWQRKDDALIEFTSQLAQLRRSLAVCHFDRFLTGENSSSNDLPDAQWWRADGQLMRDDDWRSGQQLLGLSLARMGQRVVIWFNAGTTEHKVTLPKPSVNKCWIHVLDSAKATFNMSEIGGNVSLMARSVNVWLEK